VWIRSCDEWDTGEAVRKQSQFRQGSRLRGQASATWHATPARGPLRQTNPICAEAISRVNAVRTRSWDKLAPGVAPEKQSQMAVRRSWRQRRTRHGTITAGTAVVLMGRARPERSRRDARATEHLAASPGLRGDDIATDRTSTPNKPNFGESDLEDKCCADKELRRIACGKSLGKTKPILRLRIADCGLCKTKPNLGRMGHLGDGAPGRPTRVPPTSCGLPPPACGPLPSTLRLLCPQARGGESGSWMSWSSACWKGRERL
jgi:hypothetical protein